MTFLKSMEINQFRGIQQLTVSDFSNINLIVGDNNSGKTTFLEAIELLFARAQLNSIRNVINQRTVLNPNSNSFYIAFTKMFHMEQAKEQLEFDICADSNAGRLEFELEGRERTVSGDEALQLSDLSAHQTGQYKRSAAYIPETAKIFTGSVTAQTGKKIVKKDISCTSLDTGGSGPSIKKEVYYIASFGHLRYDLLQNIVNNPDYKKLTIDILRQFDDSIADICYTKADDGNYLETIITKNGVNMPFSVYGDGVKKILYILNKLFDATDSILLIDEIETGLHKKYYDTLFPVVFALARKLNVQLFITTHNIEVIDAILRYGNYEESDASYDPIKVITLKKVDSGNGSNIAARNVTGKYVHENRKVFNFEVRL